MEDLLPTKGIQVGPYTTTGKWRKRNRNIFAEVVCGCNPPRTFNVVYKILLQGKGYPCLTCSPLIKSTMRRRKGSENK